jgi:glycosyltransferase involved in cell wall biosynthesis
LETAVIIPAYNEEKNISNVLSVVCKVKELSEIIVVNDGSDDKTSEVARSFGIKVVDLPRNKGKGIAMRTGVQNTSASVILFLDADLVGLRPEQIISLISPIHGNIADMTLGIFSSGRRVTDLAQKMAPFLTGQRAVKRWILEELSENDWSSGFGIEIALTRYAKDKMVRISNVLLENVTHTMKEEKMGFAKGVAARVRMYWEIAKELNKI